MSKGHKGFTLIELLVVIAIIGLLATVVFASLSDARSSGADAAIQKSLSNARSQAELVYVQSGLTFTTVCSSPRIQELTNSAARNAGVTGGVLTDSVSTANTVTCNDSPRGWAIIAPLRGGTMAWCVDSTGFAGRVPVNALTAPVATFCQYYLTA